jgi:tRNA (adenine22-N1)-methyltransferase
MATLSAAASPTGGVGDLRMPRRLAAVAAPILAGGVVADIGSDHALVPRFAALSRLVPRAIATERTERSAAAARHNCVGLPIEVRVGDGFEALRCEVIATAVMAGMGGDKIVSLCERGRSVIATLQRLILQPNTRLPTVRRFIDRARLKLVDEQLVEDRGKRYCVFVIDPRATSPTRMDELDFLLGPLLRRRKDAQLRTWMCARVHTAELAWRAAHSHGSTHADQLAERWARLRRAYATL